MDKRYAASRIYRVISRRLFRGFHQVIVGLLSYFIPYTYAFGIMEVKRNRHKYFYLDGHRLEYFFHSYNNNRLTERCVEIPIIKHFLAQRDYRDVLEIGNVTKHYYDDFKDFHQKVTVDKYETSYDVVNVDIKEHKTDKAYDFIYSISTFEHMDSDGGRNPEYSPYNGDKFTSYAFDNLNHVLNKLLADGGILVCTFPLGYCNKEIDNSIYNLEYEHFNLKQITFGLLKKVSKLEWKQVGLERGRKAKYNSPRPSVNYLCYFVANK